MPNNKDQNKRDYEAGQRDERANPGGMPSLFRSKYYYDGVEAERNRSQAPLSPESTGALGTLYGWMFILPIMFVFAILRLVWYYPKQTVILIVLGVTGFSLLSGWQRCGWLDVTLQRSGCHLGIPVENANNAAFSPDGKLLVVASRIDISLFNVDDGRLLQRINTLAADDLDFAPDGTLVAVVVSGRIDLYSSDGSNLQYIRHIQPNDYIRDVVFSPDAQVLGYVADYSVGLIHLKQQNDQVLYRSEELLFGLPVTISSTGLVATVLEGETIQIWDVKNGQPITAIQHTEFVHDIVLTPDGKSIFITSGPQGDYYVQQRAISDGGVLQTFRAKEWTGTELSISSDGQVLATFGSGKAHFWDVSNGVLQGTADLQAFITFSPVEPIVASEPVAHNGTALWNVPNMQ